jgi:perosamine synthetase
MIDLFAPYIPDDAKIEVLNTLNSRWVGQGPKGDRFEEDFKRKFGVDYAIALNSGSSALETAYELAGIKAGDEVIATPLTCTATNIPLLRMGATIVWADINKHTLCLDRTDVRRKITDKTKAIVNVHLGGIESDLGNMPVPVVSDACQALGVFNGDYTCCSFQAIKHITTGDGGMLVVNSSEEAHKAKLMRWFGIDREKKIANNWSAYQSRQMTFDIEIHGYKRQMTDLAASMGIVGLRHYDYVIEYRKKLFNLYKELLKGVSDIVVVDGKKNVYWLCTVLVEGRDDFAKMLFENEVDTNLVQIRNDVYNIFGGRADNLPVMDAIESKYISLPLNMKTTEDDVYKICKLIKAGW